MSRSLNFNYNVWKLNQWHFKWSQPQMLFFSCLLFSFLFFDFSTQLKMPIHAGTLSDGLDSALISTTQIKALILCVQLNLMPKMDLKWSMIWLHWRNAGQQYILQDQSSTRSKKAKKMPDSKYNTLGEEIYQASGQSQSNFIDVQMK